MLVISVTDITSCRVLYKGLKYYTNMGQSAVECLLYKYELCMRKFTAKLGHSTEFKFLFCFYKKKLSIASAA